MGARPFFSRSPVNTRKTAPEKRVSCNDNPFKSISRRRSATMTSLRRLLLVEDDTNDVELTLRALGEHNLANEVFVVRDGVEALDYLSRRGTFADRAEGNPVAILLDLKMPKMDGLQVLRALKADELLRSIPVVILTSSREERDLRECYQLGINAYVVKPVHFAEFIDAVKHVGIFWALINEPPPGIRRSPTPDPPPHRSGS